MGDQDQCGVGYLRTQPGRKRSRSATQRCVRATLKDAGYQVVDHFYTANMLELPNVGWRGHLMKLPRRLAFGLHPDLAARILGGYSLMVLAR